LNVGLLKRALLVDPELDWIVNKDNILSQGKNTPLINQVVKGKF
jgi:dihydroorotase